MQKRRIIYGLILLSIAWFAYINRSLFVDMLSITAFSMLLAAILSPFCTFLERKGLSGGIAAASSLLVFLLFLMHFKYIILLPSSL